MSKSERLVSFAACLLALTVCVWTIATSPAAARVKTSDKTQKAVTDFVKGRSDDGKPKAGQKPMAPKNDTGARRK